MEPLPDLGSLSDEQLKKLKDELEAEERDVSYRRRILHGKIDILRAELVARLQRSGGRSILDDVEGVGPTKKRALLRRFGSVRAMREAPVSDLAAVAGVGSALAERIKQAIES